MGSYLTLQAENNISVSNVTVSQDLLKRLTANKSSEEIDLSSYILIDDAEWMHKLKCIDEAHSNAYGLNSHEFYKLIDKIENDLTTEVQKCPTEKLIKCLQECSFPSDCRQILDEFMDCVDTRRIEIIKEKIKRNEQNRK